MEALNSYQDWKHCITELCGIPLTQAFIEQRLAALRDATDGKTRQFVEVWGEPHRQRVIGWFEQAQREVAH
ncbi:hypothetical protein [Algiphilus sp.]|uniref:hypothetical protein n=1 Tax=Algiphilus sp. TaxID=1872431 RepID=UPI002A5FAC3D|nr:hypothetical protein [Pseudomonadota bacterium]